MMFRTNRSFQINIYFNRDISRKIISAIDNNVQRIKLEIWENVIFVVLSSNLIRTVVQFSVIEHVLMKII